MKLYEIAQTYEDFMTAVENGDIPEEAIADTLEAITAELDDKADNIACMLKNMTAECAAIRAEEINLANRRKTKERQCERLKNYLSETLLRAGYTKIETARNKITFRKSEKVILADDFIEWALANNRDDLLSYAEPTANKTEIKKALAAGAEIEGASIVAGQNIQIT